MNTFNLKVPAPHVWCLFLCILSFSTVVISSQSCQTVITVDRNATTDCGVVAESSANRTCNDLQDALLSIEAQEIVYEPGGCVEVVVSNGSYLITEFITVSQNLVLRAEEQASVSVNFNFTDKFDPMATNEPQYILSFCNTSYATVSGMDFSDSPGIVAFENVSTVRVKDCTFRYFFQGAVDVYNCQNTTVQSCIFEHNGPVSVFKLQQYRGHAGGLSLGYSNDIIIPQPTATVSNCTFRNNTSDPLANLIQSSTQLLTSFVFTGRGGACAVPVNPVFSLNVHFEDCLFEDNFARSFGGGLYVAFSGYANHTVVLNRVKIIRNRTPNTAGGLEIGFVESTVDGALNSLLAYNSEFIENSALYGGGIFFFAPGPPTVDGRISNHARFENCTFMRNTADVFGAAIGMITLPVAFQSTENILPLEFHSCTFLENDGGGGGALSTAYLPLSFSGSNLWQGNRGRTLVLVGALAEVHGAMRFVGNDGRTLSGAALYLTSLSQLELFQGADFSFSGNTGVLGAAIVVENHEVPQTFSQVLHNPLCMVRYEDPTVEPDNWENVLFNFAGNKAVVASAVFMNNLQLCSWVRQGTPWFDEERVFRWPFVNLSDTNINTVHTPDQLNPEWSIQTPADAISVTTKNVTAYPGEQFQLGLIAFDELGRPGADVIRLSDEQARANFRFIPSVATLDQISTPFINTSFSFTGIQFGTNETVIVETVLGEFVRNDTFTITPAVCPAGYILSTAQIQSTLYSTCECNSNNLDIRFCTGRRILLRDGLWATSDFDSVGDHLVTYPCPREYCTCSVEGETGREECRFEFDGESPERQCHCLREGLLCGSCKEGRGVSALLNRCVTCHNASGLLIAVLVIAIAVVFLGLLLFVRSTPVWIYSCSFYIQVLPYLTEHFPLTFEKIRPYLYYVSSASSFYFVYDFCLYGSMSALVSYFLRYLPLIVAVIVCTGFVIFRHYYKNRKWKLPWHGIWWMFLLQYSHVVHTSLSLLNCPMLPGTDGSTVPRWFINGDVRCFTGGHIPLGLLAIFVLACCVGVIPLMVAYSLGLLQRPRWLRHSVESSMEGFKKNFNWWPAVELARRMFLLTFIVAFPQNDYSALLILAAIITVYGFIQPFKSKVYNVLEAVLSVNVLILLLLRNTEQLDEDLQVLDLQNQNDDGCIADVKGVTTFSWVLLPVYYFPLVVTLTVALTWITLTIRAHIQKHKAESGEEEQEAQDISDRDHHKVTSTELVIELDASEDHKSHVAGVEENSVELVSVIETNTDHTNENPPGDD